MANKKEDEKISKMYFEFKPDYAIPPGNTLLETIEHLGMSQAELARRTGRPPKTINEIIKGKAAITPDTALQFERVLGVPANFWNNLERNFRELLAELEEKNRLEGQVEWLKQIPVSSMVKYGWIEEQKNKVDKLKAVLNFFGVASVEAWQDVWGKFLSGSRVAFRKSATYESETGALTVWIRKGQIEAKNISCKPFDPYRFKRSLDTIKVLTKESPEVFVPEMTTLCANSGIAAVFIPEMTGCRVNGATYWASPEKAVIQMSLRYKTDDHLWFTFFHEAGHILEHGKREVFLEYEGQVDKSEEEANFFAAEKLIPKSELQDFIDRGRFSSNAVMAFANRMSIAPGIVVGRLQHDGVIPFRNLNGLKRYFKWSN